MADSFQLKAIITAVDQLSGPLKGMQRELKGFQKEMAGLALGATAAGTAILGALALPINSAMGFESKMADIRKVVDGLDDKKAFAQMSDDILTLSTQLPMAAEGIAEIVAAGGQAGIARSDLMQFANDAVKMGVAFDTTAEESGQMMAQWRTSFKLTQDDVVVLADKINYLGNTGPANAAKISEIVTRIGPLGSVAGVASGEIAAMGATIAGMGVESEIASTGIKNFMLSLTAGNSATKAQKQALAFLKLNPKQLAEDMQKDSRGAMLRVLDSLAKVPKAKQAAVMNALFGKESLSAIAPLLTNLDLLRTNFNRVADAQEYGGSMQKEYASRAATTENQLVLLKNSVNAISVTLGDTFLPAVNEAAKAVMPYLEQVRTFVRANPELVQAAAKFGAALLGVGVSIGVLSRAIKILNTVINLSPAKLAITALAAGAMLIIQNWDDVAPVIKAAWVEVDKVAQAFGGWETVLGGVGLYMTGVFTVKTLGTLRTALTLATQLSGVLGKIATLGATTVQIAVAIYMFEQLKEIADAAKEADHTDSFWQSLKNRWNAGGWYNNKQQVQQRDMLTGQTTRDNFSLSPPLLNQGPVLDRAAAPAAQRSELKVTFDNAPPGMRVLDIPKSGNPLMDVTHDVGYSPFRTPR
ncbi:MULTISPECIES: phage tail tape measure protein [Citrobacter freundii complex]|uniref:phage tail tape measure protein n=1 Tax=Citrobacter freundii complex TaxID=1344959 RepID=UPI000650D36E|nr:MULTISPECIES: phage tail tape measure protein [Citrobacter freundii complex]EKV4359838.1 phage tail tape measure protein [Citrobacter freundii]ELE2062778.1 phage tail tape measure protein [Citrobacter freundii]ELK6675820.1 phage tail tape measure protein [Citrobacter freundii]KLV84194.1 phage tail tape measure protein, TP901 family, core region [Citrobacter sp. MGH109]MBN4827942.1 phage tail tape measure protein [Citrobacter freundii]